MLKYFSCILGLSLIFSCNSSEKSEKQITIVDGKDRYEVYEGSEMAHLMRGMHAFNLQLKKEVESGEITTDFPEAFLQIHSAEFSEAKSRTERFDHYSGQFIEAQKLIFEEDSSVPLSERYNNAINLCLSCHKTECTGPIPKIQKLLIK